MPIKTAELPLTDGMHFDVETGTGRTFAFDDVAEDGLGPVETVLASLAACSAMDVISVALKKRQPVVTYRIHVRGEQREEYPQVYTRIDIVHEVEGPGVSTAAIARCIELSATKYCPVSAMLSAGATEIHHAYRVTPSGRADRGGRGPGDGAVSAARHRRLGRVCRVGRLPHRRHESDHQLARLGVGQAIPVSDRHVSNAIAWPIAAMRRRWVAGCVDPARGQRVEEPGHVLGELLGARRCPPSAAGLGPRCRAAGRSRA